VWGVVTYQWVGHRSSIPAPSFWVVQIRVSSWGSARRPDVELRVSGSGSFSLHRCVPVSNPGFRRFPALPGVVPSRSRLDRSLARPWRSFGNLTELSRFVWVGVVDLWSRIDRRRRARSSPTWPVACFRRDCQVYVPTASLLSTDPARLQLSPGTIINLEHLKIVLIIKTRNICLEGLCGRYYSITTNSGGIGR